MFTYSLIFYCLALISAITIHEFAHAYMANRLGDPTPQIQGRLTLNPKAHLDLYGSLVFLFLFITGSPFVIGWGKPVIFDPFNLRSPRRDAALISLAGPMANLILAIICGILLKILGFVEFMPNGFLIIFVSIVSTLLQSIIITNIVLAIFNLLPVHPLDGFKIVGGLLSSQKAKEWESLQKYGYIFLMLLVFPIFSKTAPIYLIMSPVINFILSILLPQIKII